MPPPVYDFVLPLFQVRWNTRAVLEGILVKYQPRSIHVISPQEQAQHLAELATDWDVPQLTTYPEESFFQSMGFSKAQICGELQLEKSLYQPGWFYQQLLKLGAVEGIPNLSEWYLVWDADLLPVDSWPIIQSENEKTSYWFALLQHNQYGNEIIVNKWRAWIEKTLNVKPLIDKEGTFVPHHLWFKQEHLRSFQRRLQTYYQSDDHWANLMMRSANDFGTFSEFWAYASWVAHHAPQDLHYYPYNKYGQTTERFFDDGTGLFSAAFRKKYVMNSADWEAFFPSYQQVMDFLQEAYAGTILPSSLSFESSPRHLQKGRENMHIEELRSRWTPSKVTTAKVL
ncbi:DUF6492 family protein [Tunicatimonas pelagia]|uniref:DUF6492 family protein n=1 Tax=Tunicatimonas pelagia TaxID=931531 RepID=UPI0026668679|nr:DUF6492 family protein [Tunicatimonas pelagia]WKN41857.1 DUF6492 family protein [Tunicatimonas pelagia]